MKNLIKIGLTVLFLTILSGSIVAIALPNSHQRSNKAFIVKTKEEREINQEETEQELEENEELEQQEAQGLQPLAKISAEQAKIAALRVQSGEVSEVELEAENGSLVYEVTIGETEVFVDAGNGKIPYTQGFD